jgi:CheY-like chemotaxis protein
MISYATDDTTSGTSLGGLIPSRQNAGDTHCALFVLRFKFFDHGTCAQIAALWRPMARTASVAIRPQSPKLPTVLLVESSALMRMAIAAYLRECGYAVIEADNPAEAQQLLEAGTETDVAFIDLEATGQIDGFALARWIRKARPDLKVLLTSGVRRAAQTAGDLCEEGPHLAKPYAHRDLEVQIRRLLAR